MSQVPSQTILKKPEILSLKLLLSSQVDFLTTHCSLFLSLFYPSSPFLAPTFIYYLHCCLHLTIFLHCQTYSLPCLKCFLRNCTSQNPFPLCISHFHVLTFLNSLQVLHLSFVLFRVEPWMALISVCKAPCKLTALRNRVRFLISELDRETTQRITKIFTIKAVQAPYIKGTEDGRIEGKRESTSQKQTILKWQAWGIALFPTHFMLSLLCFFWGGWGGVGFTTSVTNTRHRILRYRTPQSGAIWPGSHPY